MSNYKTFSFTVVGIVTTMAIVCHLGVQALDKATAQQCKTHAWPQAAHQIHMDWCVDNGMQQINQAVPSPLGCLNRLITQVDS
jgi:hypothetical protein